MNNNMALTGAAQEGLADKLKHEAQSDALLADYYGLVAKKDCEACAEFQCDFCILGSGFSECGEDEYGRRQDEKHDPANHDERGFVDVIALVLAFVFLCCMFGIASDIQAIRRVIVNDSVMQECPACDGARKDTEGMRCKKCEGAGWTVRLQQDESKGR